MLCHAPPGECMRSQIICNIISLRVSDWDLQRFDLPYAEKGGSGTQRLLVFGGFRNSLDRRIKTALGFREFCTYRRHDFVYEIKVISRSSPWMRILFLPVLKGMRLAAAPVLYALPCQNICGVAILPVN